MSEPEESEEFKIHKELTAAIEEWWRATLTSSIVKNRDPEMVAKMTVVALTRMAAVFAVDLSMKKEQFGAVCKANYEEAYESAPKWG